MRQMFICGNWKMNTNLASATKLAGAVKMAIGSVKKIEAGICPPFTYLAAAAAAIEGSAVSLGAQNMYFEKDGAFTGEISAAMLVDCGCKYVILGHSERRHILGEADALINKKVHAAYAGGLTPILCVGELLDEREGGRTESVVERHVTEGLKGVAADKAASVVIAYEPVWAIGTGKTASPAQANDVHAFIRGLLTKLYGKATAEAIRIQYGGSVKPENTFELMKQTEVDGALVGGASLKAESFATIMMEADRACC